MQNKIIMLFLSAFALGFPCMSCVLFSEPELIFSPASLPEAQLGTPYEVEIQITENGNPLGGLNISEGALPKGLTLELISNEDKLRIYGVPEEAGIFKFDLSVSTYYTNSSGQTSEKEYTIIVK